MSHFKSLHESPMGVLTLLANEHALTAVLWPNDDPTRVKIPIDLVEKETKVLSETKRQLDEYFTGKRKNFDIPLDMYGTDFQKIIWTELTRIPFGQTRTYGQLAKKINQPTASRAVGAANGRNPISIIVPCHRVIGNDGKLTGFAGGLAAKQTLLTLEGHLFLL